MEEQSEKWFIISATEQILPKHNRDELKSTPLWWQMKREEHLMSKTQRPKPTLLERVLLHVDAAA